MIDHELIDNLLAKLTPELAAAFLLVLASACFFFAALGVLLIVRRPGEAAAPSAIRASDPDGRAVAGASPERGGRRRSAAAGLAGIDRAVATGGAGSTAGTGSASGTSVGGARDFDHEIALARQGCSAEQLVRECGMSRVEARLLVRLYGSDAA